MKLSDGLFLRCSRDVASDYPEIIYGEHIVDNACMQLVTNPTSTTCCSWKTSTATSSAICAPPSWEASAWFRAPTIGESCAIFEAVHGTAPDIAGQDRQSHRLAALRRTYAGAPRRASGGCRIHHALDVVYSERKHLTQDMGGTASTTEFADAMIAALAVTPVEASSWHRR